MGVAIVRFAFFLLIGLAILGVLVTTITVFVLEAKVIWMWFKAHVRSARAGRGLDVRSLNR